MFTPLYFKGLHLCFFIVFDEKKWNIWLTLDSQSTLEPLYEHRGYESQLWSSKSHLVAVQLSGFSHSQAQRKWRRRRKNPTAAQRQHSRVNAHKLAHLTRRTFFWPGSVMSFNTPPRAHTTTHALGPEWTCDRPTRQRCADCDWLCFLEVQCVII